MKIKLIDGEGSRLDEYDLPESICDFLNDVERMCKKYQDGRYASADVTKEKLINDLDDIMRAKL